MKKRLLIATAFALGIGGAFASNGLNAKTKAQTAWSNQGSGCVEGSVDNTTETCNTNPGTACTISGQQAYGSASDCDLGQNPLSFQ